MISANDTEREKSSWIQYPMLGVPLPHGHTSIAAYTLTHTDGCSNNFKGEFF